jgi:hypothetical protein
MRTFDVVVGAAEQETGADRRVLRDPASWQPNVWLAMS